MAGVRWTRRGAVALPETLQVRLEPRFAGRLFAGAPVPGRALGADELDANLAWFTDPGPRGRPVSGLVLSGLPADPSALAASIASARARSVRQVVAHVDGPRLESAVAALGAVVDRWVAAVRAADEVVAGAELVVPLEAVVLPHTAAIGARAAAIGAPRIVFTWPFPAGPASRPPSVPETLEAIRAGLARLAAVPWFVKGLPPCVSAPLGPRVAQTSRRSSNRWYVDADHQRERALLFQPDVLQLAKQEVCRFCDVDPRCDGVAEAWLRAGLVPPLRPIREGGPET